MTECFVCWDPEQEDEPTGDAASRNAVYAHDVELAAETYAEAEWGNVDPYEETTIHVRDASGGLHVVNIEVDYSPSFYGTVKS